MSTDDGIHEAAVEEFVERVHERETEGIESIYLFGSVARGEARGRDSDADLFVVLSDEVDRRETEDELRDLAYEVMIDHDVAISVHSQKRSRFEERCDHPFVRRVTDEGIAYA
ncbi:nucleotidyltransferase domain-containing protein [Halalkalicoccus tibetensis]|uniref:Nucleotidyltransferase domain-containing protein n=1 Tax=Halalkalicoccus tibetensis TaxID=175632 RepID=A0ABD5UXL6_9EURY